MKNIFSFNLTKLMYLSIKMFFHNELEYEINVYYTV